MTKAVSGLLGFNNASKAYDGQAAALQAQIDAMKAAAANQTSVQVASTPEAEMQNADENVQINAQNELARKRRRQGLASTYANQRLYGALGGGTKNVLGG